MLYVSSHVSLGMRLFFSQTLPLITTNKAGLTERNIGKFPGDWLANWPSWGDMGELEEGRSVS